MDLLAADCLMAVEGNHGQRRSRILSRQQCRWLARRQAPSVLGVEPAAHELHRTPVRVVGRIHNILAIEREPQASKCLERVEAFKDIFHLPAVEEIGTLAESSPDVCALPKPSDAFSLLNEARVATLLK
jgi:hypothetical protein